MLKGKIYTRKPSRGGNLYKWQPIPNQIKKNALAVRGNIIEGEFCNATPNSQGEDRIVTYMYTILVVGGQTKKLAYVECGYVE